MPTCAVLTCRNSSSTVGDKGIIFHSFPRNERKSLLWFMKCKRQDKKRAGATDRICSAHFTPNDYERDVGYELFGKEPNPKLKDSAVPSLNLPYLYIKPAEARKILKNPTLARHLSRSSVQGGSSYQKPKTVHGLESSLRSVQLENLLEKDNLNNSERDSPLDTSKRPNESSLLDAPALKHIRDESHSQTLLRRIQRDESSMDVTIKCQNKEINAHKVVLRQASGYFKQVLEADPAERPNDEVLCDEVEYEDLSNLITFIYQGEVFVKTCDLTRLMKAAGTLEVYSLTESDRIVKKLNNNFELNGNAEDGLKNDPSQFVGSRSSFRMVWIKILNLKPKKKRGLLGKHAKNARQKNAKESFNKKYDPHCGLSELKNGLFSALYLLY